MSKFRTLLRSYVHTLTESKTQKTTIKEKPRIDLSRKLKPRYQETQIGFVVDKKKNDLVPDSIPQQNKLYSEPDLTSQEKGDRFEDYIIHKFDPSYFLLIDMRSDKGSNGIYPKSNQYPDLVWRYKPNSFEFAVECKWRTKWGIGSDEQKIDIIGGDHKLAVYNRFSQQRNIPVWIALGVSGLPDNPAELYIVPLHAIQDRYVEYDYLQQFQHYDISKNIYLDTYSYTLH